MWLALTAEARGFSGLMTWLMKTLTTFSSLSWSGLGGPPISWKGGGGRGGGGGEGKEEERGRRGQEGGRCEGRRVHFMSTNNHSHTHTNCTNCTHPPTPTHTPTHTRTHRNTHYMTTSFKSFTSSPLPSSQVTVNMGIKTCCNAWRKWRRKDSITVACITLHLIRQKRKK